MSLQSSGPSAAIITCHNYGRFLRQCLDSLLAQSLPFDHIIVVDDASTDDTAAICAQYAWRGVRYMRGEWRNFTQARRAGLAAIEHKVGRLRFLLFVDSDNWLSSSFHAQCREAMRDPHVGVAYAPIRYHREDGTPSGEPDRAEPFDYRRLRNQNFADACSFVRAEAYEQAGGWRDVVGPTDWLLWLMITRLGWTMQLAPAATLHYRRHSASMSQDFSRARSVTETNVRVMREGHAVTIVTLFSGRDWNLPRFIGSLAALDWPRENLRMVAIDNSRDAEFSAWLRRALPLTGIAHIVIEDDRAITPTHSAGEFADDRDARSRNAYALSAHLARLYARAREAMPAATDLVWSIEDDIDVPSDALDQFCRVLWEHRRAGVISGCVQNRFSSTLIAWAGNWPDYERTEKCAPFTVAPPPGAVAPLLNSGLMCTLFRREVWDEIAFRPAPMWNERRPYYDWAIGREVARLGWQWLLAGSIRCGHWQRDGTCLRVAPPHARTRSNDTALVA
ncbi:MAG: glycosyltransferase [Chthoniobacteraceae bacterium]